MKLLKALSLSLSLLALLPVLAQAREVPIADFFRDAQFETVTLSPDGKHMAVTVNHGDRGLLAVLRVSDKQLVGKWDYGENRYIRGVMWANNDRILFRVTFKTGSLDYQTARGDMYASNIDGSKRMDIPNGNTYSIVDLTPEDPDTILVERSVERAYLSKLNVNTGNVITVASAPLDYGHFVLDHDRNLAAVRLEQERHRPDQDLLAVLHGTRWLAGMRAPRT